MDLLKSAELANSGDEETQKICRERIALLDRFIRARIHEGHHENKSGIESSSWARADSPASPGQPTAIRHTSIHFNTRDTAHGNTRLNGVLKEEDLRNLSEDEQLQIAIEQSKVAAASTAKQAFMGCKGFYFPRYPHVPSL